MFHQWFFEGGDSNHYSIILLEVAFEEKNQPSPFKVNLEWVEE